MKTAQLIEYLEGFNPETEAAILVGDIRENKRKIFTKSCVTMVTDSDNPLFLIEIELDKGEDMDRVSDGQQEER